MSWNYGVTMSMRNRSVRVLGAVLLGLLLQATDAPASEQHLAGPGGGPAIIISDDQGLSFRVEIDGKTVVNRSPLGLEFQDGAKLGPAAIITKAATKPIESARS